MSRQLRFRTDLPLLLVVLAVYLALVRRMWFVVDDAYVGFRYAARWAGGEGLSYNPGMAPPVEGVTNWGWVFLCAGLERLGWSPPESTPWVGIGSGIVLLVIWWRSARVSVGLAVAPTALAACALVACAPFPTWATGGLETMTFTMCTFLVFERLVLEKRWQGAALAAIPVLVLRLDGIVWLTVIGLAALAAKDDREDTRFEVARFAAVVVCWFGVYTTWRLLTFGEVVPNVLLATVSFTPDMWSRGLLYVVSLTLTLITPLLFIVGAVPAIARHRGLGSGLLALSLLAPALAVVAGGDHMAYGRLLVPSLPFSAMLLAIILDRQWHVESGAERPYAGTIALVIAVVGALPLFGVHLLPVPVRNLAHFRADTPDVTSELEMWKVQRDNARNWSILGRAVAQVAVPTEAWVTGAIGARGYYSGVVIFDRGGLVDREVAGQDFTKPALKFSPGHGKTVRRGFFIGRSPGYLRIERLPPNLGPDGVVRKLRQWSLTETQRMLYVPELRTAAVGEEFVQLLMLRRLRQGEDAEALWRTLGAETTVPGERPDARDEQPAAGTPS